MSKGTKGISKLKECSETLVEFISDEFESSIQYLPILSLLRRLEDEAIKKGELDQYLQMLYQLAEQAQMRTMGLSWKEIFSTLGLALD